MGLLDGQVAIVTGAGGGLGRSHALALAAEGARVVVNDYGGDTKGNAGTSAMAAAVVEEIRAAGGEAVANASDVATDAAAIVASAVDAFGAVHVVVNNAGISGGGGFGSMVPAEFERMLDIHLGGTVAVCRAAWPHFVEQGYGRIVNTSSASVFGLPGTPAYITAKAGIFGFSRALAHDGKPHGIAVNAIMPSAYSRMSGQSPELGPVLERHFPAERVSPFVVALCSRDVPVNGETFVVGGGRAARVVLGTVTGLSDITTPADCLARFDEAMRMDGFVVPEDAMKQFHFELTNVAPRD